MSGEGVQSVLSDLRLKVFSVDMRQLQGGGLILRGEIEIVAGFVHMDHGKSSCRFPAGGFSLRFQLNTVFDLPAGFLRDQIGEQFFKMFCQFLFQGGAAAFKRFAQRAQLVIVKEQSYVRIIHTSSSCFITLAQTVSFARRPRKKPSKIGFVSSRGRIVAAGRKRDKPPNSAASLLFAFTLYLRR